MLGKVLNPDFFIKVIVDIAGCILRIRNESDRAVPARLHFVCGNHIREQNEHSCTSLHLPVQRQFFI